MKNEELSRAALMAVTGGVIAGVSYIAGMRKGSKVGRNKMDLIFKLGEVQGLMQGLQIAKAKAEKDNQEGK